MLRREASLQTLATITIYIVFIVIFFAALSVVRPDVNKERLADPLLESRDRGDDTLIVRSRGKADIPHTQC
jgi:hypothetical protein